MLRPETARVALLFTDVVDSTQLNARLGDRDAVAWWTEHDRRARELLAACDGREIDRTDGFFAIFEGVADGANFATAYHVVVAQMGAAARVGIHHGAVTLRPNPRDAVERGAKPFEVEGLAKPFAARVMALAAGGQTLLSEWAHAAWTDAPADGRAIECHGHYRLKGIDDPVTIFEVGAAASAFVPPPDVDKAYRVVFVDGQWQSLLAVPNNLVPERDRFIGRDDALRELARTFDDGARLVTLLGPGGMGKTRIARRYARGWLGSWPGGVYFCDLSEARSPEGVHLAVAVALGVALGAGDPGLQLGHAFAARGRCLVILDNVEQVAQVVAATLERWLDRAADARFLVTSRERLRLAGERLLPVEPLNFDGEAIELFAERARAQRADFELGPQHRTAVARIVRLLDGMPLAIELAAARVRVLSPPQIQERLAQRFQLLAGARTAVARQATLRAAIDWSWNMLDGWEQSALSQASVFEGGFTLPAAEAVIDLRRWPAAPAVMDVVQSLVDKSLLRAWVPAQQQRFEIDEPHFGMYLSIRDYAAERCAESSISGERDAHVAHGRYFAAMGGDEAIDSLAARGGVPRRRALALEIDNLVSACRRAAERGDAATAVATCRAAWEVLSLQGPLSAMSGLVARVLATKGLTEGLRAQACLVRGHCARRSARIDEALAWLGEGLKSASADGDRRLEGRLRAHLGIVLRQTGQLGAAETEIERALALARSVGDRRCESLALAGLASVRSEVGGVDEARPLLELALSIDRDLGDRSQEVITLTILATQHKEQSRFQRALELDEQALEVCREIGQRSVEGYVLSNMSNVQLDLGQLEQALLNQEAALVIHREVGNRSTEGIVLSNLGNVLVNLGRIDLAAACFESALAITRETGNRLGEGFALYNLGALRAQQGRLDEGLAACESGVALLREVRNKRTEGVARAALAEVLMRLGRDEDARGALEIGESLLRESGDRLELATLLCVRGRLECANEKHSAARATLAEAVAIAEDCRVGPRSGARASIAALDARLAAIDRPARTGVDPPRGT